MEYTLVPSRLFLEQIESLSPAAKAILKKRLLLTKGNPGRNKRIHEQGLLLFRIRFEDNKREKRAIYLVEGQEIKVLCILDRADDYKDLRAYLERAERRE